MLTISHYVSQSAIHGLGLFCDEDICKDQLIWTYVPEFDRAWTPEEFLALPDIAKEYIKRYGWLDKDDKMWHISVDGDKYFNYSHQPNTYVDDEGNIRANVDILSGTELTADYAEFDIGVMCQLNYKPIPPKNTIEKEYEI